MKQATNPTPCPTCAGWPIWRLPHCELCHGTGKIYRWEDTLTDRLNALLVNVGFLAFVAVGFVVIAAVVVLWVAVLLDVIG